LNECMYKRHRAHFLSSEYSHHVYAHAPTLASSFHALGDEEASIVGISAIIPE